MRGNSRGSSLGLAIAALSCLCSPVVSATVRAGGVSPRSLGLRFEPLFEMMQSQARFIPIPCNGDI